MLTKLFNTLIKHRKVQVNKHWGSSGIIFKMNSTDTNASDINLFTPEEEEKILNIINKQKTEDLSQYSITKKRAQNLTSYRSINGPFGSLEELLQVNDIDHKNLYKFYKSIINDKKRNTSRKAIRGLVITPKVTSDTGKDINTILGIHTGVDMISWSLLNRDCVLLQWNYESLLNHRKEDIHSLLQITLPIAAKLPRADRYIMQEFGSDSVRKSPIAYQAHLTQSMINAIILSHLATLYKFDTTQFITNNIFVFRKNVLQKLYGLVIGKESISTQYMVQKLFNQNEELLKSKECLPTVFIKPEFRDMYNKQSAINKEQIGWPLLIALAFVELIVHERSDLKIRNIE